MNKEIKFRAICMHSGDYVYGNFIHSKRFKGCGNEYRIHNQDTGLESDIDIETLGQFVGIKDKNGKEIYDGNIINIFWGQIKYIAKVIFCKKRLQYRLKLSDGTDREFDYFGFNNLEINEKFTKTQDYLK